MEIILWLLVILVPAASAAGSKDLRVYTFAFSNDGFPANYIKNGQLMGQSIDMVTKICNVAKKDCAVVFVPRKQCWDTDEFPPFSQVLNTRSFDVCANLPLSPERNFTYLFAREPFFRTPFPLLIKSHKSHITIRDLKKCNNFTVGYPQFTAVEPDCLLDLGLFIREENFIPVSSRGDLVDYMTKMADMVVSKKIDMAIVIPRFLVDRKDVKSIAELSCANEYKKGLNVMVRLDNKAVVQWWQSTLHKFMCVGTTYKRFCAQLTEEYGIDPLCRIPGEDLDCSKYGGLKAEAIKEARRIPRIDPCIQKCKPRLLKHGQEFFDFMDDPDRHARKALKGSTFRYKGEIHSDVKFTIVSKNGGLFKVKKLCLSATYVSLIIFKFKSFGVEEVKETQPYDTNDVWFSVCVTDVEDFHTEVHIVLMLAEDIQARPERRIRVDDLYMEACVF